MPSSFTHSAPERSRSIVASCRLHSTLKRQPRCSTREKQSPQRTSKDRSASEGQVAAEEKGTRSFASNGSARETADQLESSPFAAWFAQASSEGGNGRAHDSSVASAIGPGVKPSCSSD